MSPADTSSGAPAPAETVRYLQVVHAIDGRARLRLPWLHAEQRPEEIARLADELSRVPGMREVEIRAYTGSVLCRYDAARLGPAAILAAIARITGVETTVGLGERPPAPPSRTDGGPGEVARELARVFKDLDDEVLRATDGKLDMGTLTTFGFLGAGALGVASGQKVIAPPWFTLAWWALRTFMLFEADAVDGADE
jgi:hypothetical protein